MTFKTSLSVSLSRSFAGLCFSVFSLFPFSAFAQSAEPGICGGSICGPSGAFTVPDFPTVASVDFSAFPANPPRPYSPAASGRAWYVATNGSDSADGTESAPFATPAHAVQLAQTGDVIWIADGEYAIGGADDYYALALNTSGVTLAAVNPGAVTLTPANDYVAVAIGAYANNLIVDGFIMQSFRAYGIEFGRLDRPQRNLVLKHLMVDGSPDAIRSVVAPTTPNPTPIVQGMLLYDVWIRDSSDSGFNCGEGPCDDVRFEALRIQMPGGNGENSGADALAFENGQNIVIFNADISGASADGIDLKADNVAVANVIVHDVVRNGVKLWRGGDVINTLIYNTGADAAVVFAHGARYRLLNTIVARHAWPEEAYAATVSYDNPEEPGQLEVVNSIFYQNNGALWVSPAFTLNVRNSIFFGSPNGDVEWRDVQAGNPDEGFQPISALAAAGGGSGNLGRVDPLFANPDAGDYALSAGSPALDAGISDVDAFPTFDLYGNRRVVGAGVDLGPVERQSLNSQD